MDLVSKIYQRLGIDERKDPFKKIASKKNPLDHFGIRTDLDYNSKGENVPKEKEVTSEEVKEKKQAILDVLEAPNMYEHLPNRWKVIASITGIEDPEVAFTQSYDGYCNLTDNDRIVLCYSTDLDSKIPAWHDMLMGKQASDDMDKEEAYDKLFQMLSRDTQERIKFEVSDPLPKENNTSEQKHVLDKVVEIGTPDEQHLVEIYREKYAARETIPCPHCGKPVGQEQMKTEVAPCLHCGKPVGKENFASKRKAQGINPQEQYPYPEEFGPIEPEQCYECGERAKPGEMGDMVTVDTDPGNPEVGPRPHIMDVWFCDNCLSQFSRRPKTSIKRKADSGPNEFGTHTTDSYTETRHEDHDGKDKNQNYPHGSPIDNNKSVIDDMLISDPTPPVYAPSESDGILFDTIQRANPQRDMPLDQDKKEFEGVNAQKKQIIASMEKSGQQWQYFLNSLNKVKELDGKFITRPLLDSGFYPILRDMEDKGFVEFKKVKITGTAPKIVMTEKGKLALTAVEEKMGQEKVHEPVTVSPSSAPADLPGAETPVAGTPSPDNDPDAQTIEMESPIQPKKLQPRKKTKVTDLPKREPVPAMKTYSVSDVEKFAPHIARVMVKSGILFTEKESFDKRYTSYISQVKAMPRVNEARLEKKAAELEIAVPLYRKLLFAQEGIKVLSHDEFSKQANVPKPKLYQYKDAGTYVKIGNDEYVVANLTEDQIFLKRAQAGYDTEKEIEESGISTPLNQYLDNRDMKFMVYEKKDDKKGKLLGYGHSHKRARMFGLANGEGNYIVEVINEKVGPPTSNTGSPEIYGIYEFEVRKMASGGSHPTDGDSLKVMNYHGVNTPETSNHVTKLVQEALKKEAQTRKVYIIYPQGIEGQDEMYDWLFDASDKMGFDFDEDSITMDSAKVWGRNIPDTQLEQRFKKSGVDYSYDETEMPELEEPTGPRQRGPKLPEEPIEYDTQEGEGMETHARLTKKAETALRALYKSFERVIRDVAVSASTFESPEDRKTLRKILDFVDDNLPALAKIAGVTDQEAQGMEEAVEKAEEVIEEAPSEPTPAAPANEVASPVTQSPEVAPIEEVKAAY